MTKKLPEFILQRDQQVRSTSGYAVVFEKGVPTPVHPVMIAEVIAIGAIRVDDSQVAHVQDPKVVIPGTGEDLEKDVRAAIDALVEQNVSSDFTASGAPKLAAVIKLVGYPVDKNDLAVAWQKRADEQAA